MFAGDGLRVTVIGCELRHDDDDKRVFPRCANELDCLDGGVYKCQLSVGIYNMN